MIEVLQGETEPVVQISLEEYSRLCWESNEYRRYERERQAEHEKVMAMLDEIAATPLEEIAPEAM